MICLCLVWIPFRKRVVFHVRCWHFPDTRTTFQDRGPCFPMSKPHSPHLLGMSPVLITSFFLLNSLTLQVFCTFSIGHYWSNQHNITHLRARLLHFLTPLSLSWLFTRSSAFVAVTVDRAAGSSRHFSVKVCAITSSKLVLQSDILQAFSIIF